MKFEKLKKLKTKRHGMTALCLLLGLTMVTSAAYANYDDAKGYSSYKKALKNLAFYEDNFTMDGRFEFLVDGKVLESVEGKFQMDGKDYFIEMGRLGSDGKSSESNISRQETYKDGSKVTYYPEDDSYITHDFYNYDIRGDFSDPTSEKAIRFAELFMDTMVGDLKNNFVLVSNEDGRREYSVELSKGQIPEIVNAGLSLIFTANNTSMEGSRGGFVTYQNYESALAAFYEKETGETLSEEQWDDKAAELSDDFFEHYQGIQQQKGEESVIVVKADGSYTAYKNYDAYVASGDCASLNYHVMEDMGNEPYISDAKCYFTLDKDGNLLSNDLEATMTGIDKDGNTHTMTLRVELDGSDYGTTKIQDFDTTGKKERKH